MKGRFFIGFAAVLILAIVMMQMKKTVPQKQSDENILSALEQVDIQLNPTKETKWIPDDYPIEDEYLRNLSSKNPLFELSAGKLVSVDKAWMKNSATDQTLIIELYTDYHHLFILHFLNSEVPMDLIEQLVLHQRNNNDLDLAPDEQKRKDFKSFLPLATEREIEHFTSKKGISLNDTKEKVLSIYGLPQKQSLIDGIEKLEWKFIGDMQDEQVQDATMKTAKNSFGHDATYYFKQNKLIAVILHNDIP